MRFFKVIVATLLIVAAAASAQAAPITVTLVRTSALFNNDPPGAPLPLARTQHDSGDVLFNGAKIGEYVRVKDVNAAGMNTAAVTLTMFFAVASGAPDSVTLQGAHSFDNGKEKGSISASSFMGLTGVGFTIDPIDATTQSLTLLVP